MPELRGSRTVLIAFGVLILALLIGFAAAQPPSPRPADAPGNEFSSGRAMADVRSIARAPRPTGSAENERARAILLGRMRQLGMDAFTQQGSLPEKSLERLRKWGAADPAAARVVNLIGVLPGRDRNRPAVLLMAHHDSVWDSPGAADDTAGVAAALEIVRALKARGTPERDVILLFTDAEELGLDGARIFFAGHPLAARVGAIVNMETRGGGGRAAMFETGRGNGEMIGLYRRSVSRPSSNSLAVLIYELMPNNTDFTLPKEKGVPGFNFAFIGKPELYHSPMATPDALDGGSLQDLGAQALGVAGALAFSPDLPAKAPDAAFGDLLGLFVIAYPSAFGWLILGVAAGLLAFTWVRLRRDTLVGAGALAGGIASSVVFLLHTMLILKVVNIVSGSGAGSNYYDRLAALPRLELQAFLLRLATLLIACLMRRPGQRPLAASPALLLMLAGIVLGDWSPMLFGLGVGAAVFAMLLPREWNGLWSGWFGFILPVLLLAIVAQIAAPTSSPIFGWPLAAASIGAAAAAAIDPHLRRSAALLPAAVLGVLMSAHFFYLGHFTFLGVGMGLAEVAALYALLIGMLLWPFFRLALRPKPFGIAAAALMMMSVGIALSVRLDPMAPTIPPYSERR